MSTSWFGTKLSGSAGVPSITPIFSGIFEGLEKLVDMTDKFIPPTGAKLPLSKSMPLKVWAGVAIASVLVSAVSSWGQFVSILVLQLILGALVMWLCRRDKCQFAWAVTAGCAIAGIAASIAAVKKLISSEK